MRKIFTLVAIAGITVVLVLFGGRYILPVLFNVSDPGSPHQPSFGDFQSIGAALRTYKINTGHYPSTEQGLKALVERPTTPPLPDNWVQTANKVPKDPWRNEYRYRGFPEDSPQPFELISNGPDGVEGTKDDRSSSDR